MRTAKVLMVTLTVAASVVMGVSGAASAAPGGGQSSKTLWCC
jgi:hypothetical protein